jgi:hypothetical protein
MGFNQDPIHTELDRLFKKFQRPSPVIKAWKPMYDYASKAMRSAFASSTRFFRSSSVSMYGINLK